MEALAAIHCKITFSEWHYQLSTIINQGKWIRLDYRTYCGSDYVDDHSRGHFVCTGWRKPLRGLLTREMNHQLSKTTFMIIYIYIFISLHKCYLWACKQIIWHHNNKKDRFTNFISFRNFWGWKWSRWNFRSKTILKIWYNSFSGPTGPTDVNQIWTLYNCLASKYD